MKERTFASQFARLVLAGAVTVVVISATLVQISASSREATRTPGTIGLTLSDARM